MLFFVNKNQLTFLFKINITSNLHQQKLLTFIFVDIFLFLNIKNYKSLQFFVSYNFEYLILYIFLTIF